MRTNSVSMLLEGSPKTNSSGSFHDNFIDFYFQSQHIHNSQINFKFMCEYFNFGLESFPDDDEVKLLQEKMLKCHNVKQKKNWNLEERKILVWVVGKFCHLHKVDFRNMPDQHWKTIASCLSRRDEFQCKARWLSMLKQPLQQMPWTQDEDQKLCEIIRNYSYGAGSSQRWSQISQELNQAMGNKTFRSGKQCRERWSNHLNPQTNRDPWTNKEDLQLLQDIGRMGKKWAEISRFRNFRRSENAVKNRYNCLIKREGLNLQARGSNKQEENEYFEQALKRVQWLIDQEKDLHQQLLSRDDLEDKRPSLTDISDGGQDDYSDSTPPPYTLGDINQITQEDIQYLKTSLIDPIKRIIYMCDYQTIQDLYLQGVAFIDSHKHMRMIEELPSIRSQPDHRFFLDQMDRPESRISSMLSIDKNMNMRVRSQLIDSLVVLDSAQLVESPKKVQTQQNMVIENPRAQTNTNRRRSSITLSSIFRKTLHILKNSKLKDASKYYTQAHIDINSSLSEGNIMSNPILITT